MAGNFVITRPLSVLCLFSCPFFAFSVPSHFPSTFHYCPGSSFVFFREGRLLLGLVAETPGTFVKWSFFDKHLIYSYFQMTGIIIRPYITLITHFNHVHILFTLQLPFIIALVFFASSGPEINPRCSFMTATFPTVLLCLRIFPLNQ